MITQGAYLAIQTIQTLKKQGFNLELFSDQALQAVPNARLKKRYRELLKQGHPAISLFQEDPEIYKISPAALISPVQFCEVLIQAAEQQCQQAGQTFQFLKQAVENLKDLEHFDWIILATGSQSQELFSQGAFQQVLPLKNSPGQISVIKVDSEKNPESFKIKYPVSYEGYCFPVINNRQLLGATYRKNNNLEILPEDHQENINNLEKINFKLAQDLKNQIQNNINNCWGRVSVRASSPDHLPLVGPLMPEEIFKEDYARLAYGDPYAKYPEPRNYPQLLLNIGHGSKGLSTSLISAWILASEVLDLALPVSLKIRQAVHPNRFWLRDLKRCKKL